MRVVFSLVLGFVLVSCAISPQQAELSMQPVAVPAGQAKSMSLQVLDVRSNKVLGHLGGTYAQTATLTLASGAMDELASVSQQSFSQSGWQLQNSAMADQQLLLRLHELQYRIERAPQWPLWDVSLYAEVSYNLKNHNGEFERKFRVREDHRVWPRPSAETNQEYVNQLINKAWAMMLQEPELADLLGR